MTGGLSGKDVEDILRLLDATQFDEIELEMDGLTIRATRGATPPPLAGEGAPKGRRGAEPERTAEPDGEKPDTEQTTAGASDTVPVVAPHVGIFYRAPAPDAEPFVEVGSEVNEDTTVAIVEVMKLMDAVAAGVAGAVARICVNNGEAVEEGQTLLLVSPRAWPPSAPSGNHPPRGGEV